MVCTAVGKRNKTSKIIETYPETLQEKAECSEGLSPQSDQMDYRILQKRRYPLCGCKSSNMSTGQQKSPHFQRGLSGSCKNNKCIKNQDFLYLLGHSF